MLLACVLGTLASFAFAQDIIVNGNFNSNVSGWALDPGFGSFSWSSDGTLLLINDAPPPNQTTSVSQCDPISPAGLYGMSAKVQPLNFGQGGPNSTSGLKRVEHTGSVYVLLDFYSLDNCRGSALNQFVRVDATGGNIWQALSQNFTAPNTAVSVLVSLAILKNQDGSNLQAEFDEISVKFGGGLPPAPAAAFTYMPTSPVGGDTVQFTDTSFFNPTSWSWDFGDPGSGSVNTATVQNPAHLFSNPGVYTVSLTAANAGGSSSNSHNVIVAAAAPVANFNYAPTAPAPGQTVQFNDTTTGHPTSWSWDFGDAASGSANTSTLQNPTHVFTNAGNYSVALSATGAGGTGLRNKAVNVTSAAPVANFTYAPPAPEARKDVQFSDASTGGPTTWSWDFGDPDSGAGNSSNFQNPSHAFSRPGSYSVVLTVGNSKGSDTKTIVVAVRCARCPRVVQFH
jgi:PKD repeat protein